MQVVMVQVCQVSGYVHALFIITQLLHHFWLQVTDEYPGETRSMLISLEAKAMTAPSKLTIHVCKSGSSCLVRQFVEMDVTLRTFKWLIICTTYCFHPLTELACQNQASDDESESIPLPYHAMSSTHLCLDPALCDVKVLFCTTHVCRVSR